MATGFTVRPATPADVPAILLLWQEMMQHHYALDNRFEPSAEGAASFHQALQEWLQKENMRILVADAGGELIGYAVGIDRDGPPVLLPPRFGYISDMSVAAAHRRQGVARALLAGLTDWFRERGLSTIRLSVAHANPQSQAFWRAMGFTDYLDTLWGDIK